MTWQHGEVQSVMGFPVLGPMARMPGNIGKLIPKEKLWSVEVNALRSIRDNIFLTSRHQPHSTLLITSCVPREGKSFLSTNLAAIMASPSSNMGAIVASPGSKVILIDADLRKPSLHEIFDMPNLIGLADILAMPEEMTEKMLKRAVRPTYIDNLFLLPAGRNPLDPGSLVSSSNFVKVLDFLKTQADLVIIDSGPILEVVETKIVANAVDGVVLVMSDGISRRRAVQRAIDYFRHKPENNLLGVVFNRVSLGRGYGYGYSGYYAAYAPKQGQTARSKSSWWSKVWPFGKARQVEGTMLTLIETAEYLGISEDLTRRWCEQGRFPAIKKGRKWLVRLEDLNEYISTYQSGEGITDKLGLSIDYSSPNGQLDELDDDAFDLEMVEPAKGEKSRIRAN
jgi:capsular exopolysaccharide synthesis family protein